MKIFENITNQLLLDNAFDRLPRSITQEEYDVWQRHTTLDSIRGLRYGQSFCNYFGISDNILYYEFSWMEADRYIRKHYLLDTTQTSTNT